MILKKIYLFFKINWSKLYEIKIISGSLKNLERPNNFIKIKKSFQYAEKKRKVTIFYSRPAEQHIFLQVAKELKEILMLNFQLTKKESRYWFLL